MNCIIVSKDTAISLLEKGKKMSHKNFLNEEYIREFDKNHYEWSNSSVISKEDFWSIRLNTSWNMGWFEYRSHDELKSQVPSLKIALMGAPGTGKTTAALLIANALREVGFTTVVKDPDIADENIDELIRKRINHKSFLYDTVLIETKITKN